MSLLTPPSTVHRVLADKENIPDIVHDNGHGSSRVIWSQKNSYHSLASTSSSSSSSTSNKHAPTKSILKSHVQTSMFLLPFPAEPEPRQVTPEPADPITDLNYLVYPVSQIVKHASDISMRELIEAYNVLAARLRASVVGKTDIDASWPLFQPLRKNKKAFVDALVRDLGRALIDPASGEEAENTPRVLLPSPKNTPKKKKGGMTAEQVKYARDLCTTSQSVIRLLPLLFTLPVFRDLFSDTELRSILTALLAIPLADDLPTPNSRKTCALAIWVIQSQRLPAAVLVPAKDRIAFALRRGIDGELGKEGKKGSASDGLKAIHDLSVSHPAIFVPTFATTLLPSVLSSLLAPTLGLRTQACHALGGFVVGLISLPPSKLHTRVSNTVAAFLTVPPPRKSPPPASPSKPNADPSKLTATSSSTASPAKPMSSPIPIINTLRTTLQAAEPEHVAAGPVWGLSVLACLLVMLSSALTDDANTKLTRVVTVLLGLAVKHPRSTVRAVGCLMWQCVIWVYFQDRLPPLDDSQGESEVEDDVKKNTVNGVGRGKEAWWKVVTTVVELNTGVSTIAALLNSCSDEDREDSDVDVDEPLQRTLEVLQYMIGKTNPKIVTDTLDTLKHLLGISPSNSDQTELLDQDEDPEKGRQWDPTTKLLPHWLFSSLPGLLSVEFKDLSTAVRPVFEETAGPEDVRALTKGEIARGSAEPDNCSDLDMSVDECSEEEKRKRNEKGSWWMWEGLVRVWRGCVMSLWEGDSAGVAVGRREKQKEAIRKELVSVWEALVKKGVGFLQDAGDDEATSNFAVRVVNVLINILQDAPLELLPPRSSPPTPECKPKHGKSSPVRINASAASSSTTLNNATKLALAQHLWHATCRLIPDLLLVSSDAPERLLLCLVEREDSLTSSSSLFSLPSIEEDEEETAHLREKWTTLCVDVLVKCNPESLRAFWGYANSDGERQWEWRWDLRERSAVWRWFVDRWMGAWEDSEGNVGWEGAVVLLGVPFLDGNAWEMDKEDLSRWNGLLEYATAQALDEGQDDANAHTVLSELAAATASHNTSLLFSTSSSSTCSINNSAPATALSSPSTRLAEFLLTTLTSSFSSGSCTQLPQSILEFVNDAIRESYPPRPRETMVFLWTARAVACAVEACPRELIESLLGGEGGIGEGVSIWIADECKAWGIGQLGYDIIPLYQHILTRIQELPLALSTLRTFASIIASPFVGRADMPPAAKDAFREFWEATYAGMKKPREGWPEEVMVCLRAVFGDVEEKDVEEAVIDPALLAPEAVLVSAGQAASADRESLSVMPTKESTPTTTAKKTKKCTPSRPHDVGFHTRFPLRSPQSPIPCLAPAAFLSSASSFPVAIPFPTFSDASSSAVPAPSVVARARTPSPGPSTPRKARMKTKSMRPNVFKSMHIPTPTTPKNVRTTSKRSPGQASPAKRRKIGDREEDKENRSPSARITWPSFIDTTDEEEREWVVKPFALGKRTRKEENCACEMSPQKKGRLMKREPEDSEDERIVESLVIPDSDDSFIAVTSASAKRKRVFMDAVEVPRLKDVYPRLRNSLSLNSLELRTPSPSCSPSHQKGPANSVTKALPIHAGGSLRKRRRASTEDVFLVSKTFSVLQDSDAEQEIPFSDSFTLDERPASPQELLSSDDDPHIGQVTPHRLISPVPRRSLSAKFYEVDPPSDDSVMGGCASPSKEVVERRLKRFGSMTNVITMTHGMVARMNVKSSRV